MPGYERMILLSVLLLAGGLVTETAGRMELTCRRLPAARGRGWLSARGGARYRGDGYYDEDDPYDEYDDYGYQQPAGRQRRPVGRSRQKGFETFMSQPMPPMLKNTGFYMLLASAVLTAVGISLFFERNILRLSNLCLVMGLPLYLGPARVLRLVFAREKMRATACFLLGVFLVLRGNSFIGTLIEIFGFFNLFANMFPLLLALLRQVPFVGDLLKRPEPAFGGREYGGRNQGPYDRDERW